MPYVNMYEEAQRTPYATPLHFLPIPEQPADRPSRTIFCIAENQDAAEAVARRIAGGRIPDLYAFACDCVVAWRDQPGYLAQRYTPWQVSVWMDATGVSRIISKKI